MKIYHYDRDNNVFTFESEAVPLQKDPNNYAIPANATTISPFVSGEELKENETYCFNEGSQEWTIIPDYRNLIYYDLDHQQMVRIVKPNVTPPKKYASEAPPSTLFKPKWTGKKWVEDGIVYKGRLVSTKQDVDNIVSTLISELGEEKAKTEKLLAGSGDCPIWNEFIAARQILLDEANAFILENKLK